MKKLIVVLFLAVLGLNQVKAQDYTTGIGLRGGFFPGVTLKLFLDEQKAFEGLVSTRWDGLAVTGLYEIHNQAFSVPGLNWYYGVGGHVGFWNDVNDSRFNDNENHTVIGADGILGIEYNFTEIPINIGLDWKPAINLLGNTDFFWGDGGAISIRYIF